MNMTDQNRPGFNPPAYHVAPAVEEIASEKPAKSSRGRQGLWVASAVGIAAVGFAGTAYAANATPSPSPSNSSSSSSPSLPGQPGQPGQQDQQGQHGPDGDNDGPGGGHGGGMRGPGMGPGIHGTFVTPNQAGTGYDTIDTQKGSVTDVSATSITVKSTDGFTKTYVVTSTTDVNGNAGDIAAVKTGDDVAILGIESGSDVNAQKIFDGKNFKPSANGNNGQNLQPGANGNNGQNLQPGQNGNQPPAPNGSTGASGGGYAPSAPGTNSASPSTNG